MPKSICSKRHELLCDLLIKARIEADLTQQQVADSLGLPQSYLAKTEGGERRLDVIEFIGSCENIEAKPLSLLKSLMNHK